MISALICAQLILCVIGIFFLIAAYRRARQPAVEALESALPQGVAPRSRVNASGHERVESEPMERVELASNAPRLAVPEAPALPRRKAPPIAPSLMAKTEKVNFVGKF